MPMQPEPSPTAAATRLPEPARTSPTANRPGTLVSKGNGSRSSGQPRGRPRLTAYFTAIDKEPGALVVYRADFAGLQPQITYTVEREGEGTRFTRAVEMQPKGLKIMMTPMMAIMVPRHNKTFVRNLKQVLES